MLQKYVSSGKKEIEKDFYIYPENWEALNIFLDLSTQWRIIAGMSAAVYQGLEYSSLVAVVNLKCEDPVSTFDDVRLIEYGALSELRKS